MELSPVLAEPQPAYPVWRRRRLVQRSGRHWLMVAGFSIAALAWGAGGFINQELRRREPPANPDAVVVVIPASTLPKPPELPVTPVEIKPPPPPVYVPPQYEPPPIPDNPPFRPRTPGRPAPPRVRNPGFL